MLISTHAPRTGSDFDVFFYVNLYLLISTHAPRTGSDDKTADDLENLTISTHAPRTGSDRQKRRFIVYLKTFQPTLPARGATLATLNLHG